MTHGGVVSVEDESARPVSHLLRRLHETSARLPIEDVDPAGAFPARLLRGPGYPVVVDANVLRNDVRYSCRWQHRTTLVNAANAGLIRPFAASHVIEEVHEHAEKWTTGDAVSVADFLSRWDSEYLPLLRVVDVPEGLLDPYEQQRVDVLADLDPDDVPSATLAIALGAFFLSEDRRASTAVYADAATAPARREWLAVLRAGGDAGQANSLFASAVATTGMAGAGVVHLARLIARHPWLLPPAAGLAAAAVARWSPERTERVRTTGAAIGDAVTQIARASADAAARFSAACVVPPDWRQLAQALDNRAVLTRKLMFDLARASGHRSAEELSNGLVRFPTSHGTTTVRTQLRQHPCFIEVYRGRWQLGGRSRRESADALGAT